MRICSPQLGLDPHSILGGEIYDHEILKGLGEQGVEVEILLPKNRPYDTTIKNWHITKLPLTHIPAWLFNLLEIPYLFSLYKQRPFQILRLHVPYFVGLGAWFFRLFRPHVKIVATYHQARSGLLYDLINKLFIHQWDSIITDNESAKQRLIEKFDIDPGKITVVHGGAPTNLAPIRTPHKNIVLLFMGLLIPRKNPLFLIDVMKELVKTNPNLKLVICGDGPLKSTMTQQIQQHQLNNNVIIHPPVHGKEKQKLYNQADIFVHPAIHEGFPLVVLEAMACGLPIVISDQPWGREAVNKENGLLVQTNNVNHWVQQTEALIKNKPLRQQMAKQSRYRATHTFTWENAARKHHELYQSLV